jgi:glutathione synthase/RimK-type ligase-like ATP-grasp enzyme
VRLDTDKLGTSECFFGSRSEPELHINGQVIRISDVAAIWARRFALPEILRQVKPGHADFVKRELAIVMDAFLEGTPGIFQINSSVADRLAGNRLVQAQRAKKAGFLVPDTLVTQDRDAARDFLAEHTDVLCKALSFGRVSSAPDAELVAFASTVPRDLALEGLASCPALFQKKISKRYDWRITTVGARAFSARAAFDPQVSPVDWRQEQDAATRFVHAEPPPDILDRLFRLAGDSGIVYGAHDLIETANGEFFFLETNPAGQWGWLELTIGLPIGRAIADELVAHSRC